MHLSFNPQQNQQIPTIIIPYIIIRNTIPFKQKEKKNRDQTIK